MIFKEDFLSSAFSIIIKAAGNNFTTEKRKEIFYLWQTELC